MDRVISPYLSVLNQINWQDVNSFNFPGLQVKEWLTEQGSLSVLMKKHCQVLSVDILKNTWLDESHMSHEERVLLNDPHDFLLRQVILSGDNVPWVFGHTLIPEETAKNKSYDFSTLGASPIGESVFQMPHVRRDALQLSGVTSGQHFLWTRRSRLWIEDKPMLVTELFLPESPVYG